MKQLTPTKIAKSKQNLTELLVNQEIERQFTSYPQTIRHYLNKVEIATFALNRLPTLYVTTEKGKIHLLKLAKQYQKDITIAVRQGFAAVQRDPLRKSLPLISEKKNKYHQAETALSQLEYLLSQRNLLEESSLSWVNLVRVVRDVLRQVRFQKKFA
jgi:hypothetical protein